MESLQAIEISPVLAQTIEQPPVEPLPQNSTISPPKPTEPTLVNSDIRTVYETVKDSIRKDSSLRSTKEQEGSMPVKLSSTTSTTSNNKTLPFEASASITQTYNNSDTGLSLRPAFRVVNDSLNSRGKKKHYFIVFSLYSMMNTLGSETIDSTSSHEEYNPTPLCTENDCDEIYRTARKGRQVGRGVSSYSNVNY